MKKLFLVICCYCFFSCATNEIQKPDFLLGSWSRLNDKPNQSTHEIWNSDFAGLGFTLQEKDTVFKEVLSIVEKEGSLFLQVEGVNEQSTLFKFTNQTKTSFTCENPDNEFPKKIQYSIQTDTLKAKVSNSDFAIDFVFVRSN